MFLAPITLQGPKVKRLRTVPLTLLNLEIIICLADRLLCFYLIFGKSVAVTVLGAHAVCILDQPWSWFYLQLFSCICNIKRIRPGAEMGTAHSCSYVITFSSCICFQSHTIEFNVHSSWHMIHLCILGMKKKMLKIAWMCLRSWKELDAFPHCYWPGMQHTLTNLDEQFIGLHSPRSISFKMRPLGELNLSSYY